jgi:phosphate-selective porin OprO/OprP
MSSRIASVLVLLFASPALAQETPAPAPVELKPGGYLQVDQRGFLTDTGTHELTVRRLRFKLDGRAFEYFKAYTLVDFAGSKLVVDDAYLEFAPRPELALRFGKNKSQFGIERLQSATELTFIERSYPTQIAPNRDIGIAVRGDIKGGAFHYSLAAVDGVANNAVLEGETDDELEYNAHVLVKPLASLAVGAAATVGRTHGTIANPGITPIKSAGQATIYKYATGASLAETAVADGFRHRLAAHAYYYTGPVGALAEYVADYEPVAYRNNHTLLFQRAWQLAASLALTPGDKPSYKGIAPKHVFDLEAGTWGAFEVAARYGEIRFDGGAFIEGIADPNVSVRRARAGTVGVNWYFNKLFKLQLNYEATKYTGGAPSGGDRPTEHLIATRFQAAI